MRLSEAIRLGSMLRPTQAFYTLFSVKNGSTCALGAAAEAVGLIDTAQENSYLPGKRAPAEWKPISRATATCPACDFDDDVEGCIIHINNEHRWTRERIADWVELQEQRIESTPSADAVARTDGVVTG